MDDFNSIPIAGTEGRAGMATVVDEQHLTDLKQLNLDLQKTLPAYARPVFLRFVEKLDMTGLSYLMVFLVIQSF